MNNHIDLQEFRRKRTEEELEQYEKRLQKHRDYLYLGLRDLNLDKEEYEKRIRYLQRYEDYFRDQERRLLLMAVIAFNILLLWIFYLNFDGFELGETIWVVSTSVLGVLLVTILTIYFLDKAGLKEQSERMILRILFHIAMSPLYLLRLIWSAIKKMFKRLIRKNK